MNVLGISTNTRLVSIAIIDTHSLILYESRMYKSMWSPAKRDLIIARLEPCVRRYCINRVYLSMPLPQHQTEAFRELVAHLSSRLQSIGIEVSTVPVADIADVSQVGYKKTLMNEVVSVFPELSRYRDKEKCNKHRYYYKLFEAVAVAMKGAGMS